MDGHFVPNLSFGPDITATVRKSTDKPLDVHLMIEEPAKWVETYIKAGATTIIFHVEAVEDEVASLGHLGTTSQGPSSETQGRGLGCRHDTEGDKEESTKHYDQGNQPRW